MESDGVMGRARWVGVDGSSGLKVGMCRVRDVPVSEAEVVSYGDEGTGVGEESSGLVRVSVEQVPAIV